MTIIFEDLPEQLEQMVKEIEGEPMNDKMRKKIITTLKNHKLSLNELAEECKTTPENMAKYIEELIDDNIDIDMTKRRERDLGKQ